MFKQILIFSLYFYFADQCVDAEDVEQLLRQLNEFLNNTIEKSDDGVPTYKFTVMTSKKMSDVGDELTISFDNFVYGESVTLQLYPLKRNVMSPNLQCWFITANYQARIINLTPINRNDFFMGGSFYQSINPRGVFYVTNGRVKRYYGVYGEGEDQRVIEPLPDSLQYVSITNFADHIVHTMNPIKPNHTIITVPDETTGAIESLKRQPNRRTPLRNLYPKLLLIVDGTYYTKFQNVYSIVRYLSVFFNIVSLRYDEVPSPKIEPIVTGIIIATVSKTINSLRLFIWNVKIICHNNIKNKTLVGSLIAASMIDVSHADADYAFSQYDSWFKRELERKLLPFRHYDSALLITSYLGYSGKVEILGLAEYALICYNKISYICDLNMNFGGVNTAIHELGHTMGLEHDNATFLMNYKNKTFLYPSGSLYLSWSTFSINSFQLFAQKQIANCLSVP